MNADTDLGLPLPRLLEISGGDGERVRFSECQAMAKALVALHGQSNETAGQLFAASSLAAAGEAVTTAQRATIRQQDERIRELEAENAAFRAAVDSITDQMRSLALTMRPFFEAVLAEPTTPAATREYVAQWLARVDDAERAA